MSTTVLEREQSGRQGQNEALAGWLEVERPGTAPRSARRRVDFIVDESEILVPVPLVPFTGDVEAW